MKKVNRKVVEAAVARANAHFYKQEKKRDQKENDRKVLQKLKEII